MKRADLEHVIRAAGTIVNTGTLVIIGSQAILGMIPNPPEELTLSQEIDLWPESDPGKSDLIDGCIGELSPFHETFGYYAHGVGPETATLVKGWEERLVDIQNENTKGIKGRCLHPLDIAVSKLVAGREKDSTFVRVMLKNHIIEVQQLQQLLTQLDLPLRDLVEKRLNRIVNLQSPEK
jgi:hypothetical protein